MTHSYGLELIARSARRAAACLAVSLAVTGALAASSPASAEEGAEGGIVLKDFILTHGVEAREPVDAAHSFDLSDGQVYAFARLFNDGPPSDVTVVWMHEGSVHASVDLAVGTSPGWRTWSSANLKPGHWTVRLVGADGVTLDERDFAVGAAYAQDYDGTITPAASPFDDAIPEFDDAYPQQADDWPETAPGDIDG